MKKLPKPNLGKVKLTNVKHFPGNSEGISPEFRATWLSHAKQVPFLVIFCLFSCVLGKQDRKNLRSTLVCVRVSLVIVLRLLPLKFPKVFPAEN